MIESLKLYFEDQKSWWVFLYNVIFAFVLAVFVMLMDSRYWGDLDALPSVMLTSQNFAQMILSSLAGSLFAVATFTFATMLSVMSYYASSFGPRTIENFLFRKVSTQTLGIYLGGFVYCLVSLFFMRESADEYLILSGTVALMYGLASVLFFIRFVYDISQSVQHNQVIKGLFQRASKIISQNKQFFQEAEFVNQLPSIQGGASQSVYSLKKGYLDFVDIDRLYDLSKECHCLIILKVRNGDFVGEGAVLAEVYSPKKQKEWEQFQEKLNRCFIFQHEPSSMYNPDFALSKLTDIALRSASPSINDPNTISHVFRYQSILLGELGQAPARYAVYTDKVELSSSQKIEVGVCYDFCPFQKILFQNFGQLVQYIARDAYLIRDLYEALYFIGLNSSHRHQEVIKEFVNYLTDKITRHFTSEYDQRMFQEVTERIAMLRHTTED
ncbi:DUF2254 domain-containing protein [Facklamia miroungae]|uniref:Uncharacterized membrane protein n=1 Tax=Facklamia miroungae TaxID=120956 RepID=A0A1G7RVN1_9LACT|nr:DUF2254 domain-containing protein [Facklamia miroungae]NKZ29288.1 DUF2254 domain-containing protein [Facklamia miroungae]SDG13840.1 Uncharacterized membrane protein [Facklamia miroungae]